MNPIAVEYRPEHFKEICPPQLIEYAELQALRTEAISYLVDGEIAVCGGLHVLWPGTAECWVLFSPKFIHSHRVVMVVKNQLREWIEKDDLQRVQAIAANAVERRFLEWLGMEYEGTMRKFGPDGVTKSLYAWVK